MVAWLALMSFLHQVDLIPPKYETFLNSGGLFSTFPIAEESCIEWPILAYQIQQIKILLLCVQLHLML